MKLIPRVSEKAVDQAAQGVYVFDVPATATKPDVAKAVAESFKVKVDEVNMLIQRGKTKTFKRIKGSRADVKKAYVKLQKGQKITLFEEAR